MAEDQDDSDDNATEPKRRPPIQPFAMIADDLFNNRKIIKAGPDAALVFIFTLCKHAASGRKGYIAATEIEPWYIGDQTRIGEERAAEGFRRAVEAKLLEVVGDRVVIVGWDETWARRHLSDSDARANRRLREKQRVASESEAEADRDAEAEQMGEKRERKKKSSPDNVRTAGSLSSLSRPTSAGERRDALRVLDYMSKISGVKWRGAAAHVDLIVERIREGITVEDCWKVIKYVADWQGLGWLEGEAAGKGLSKQFRPETLFARDKIERYLDPARAGVEIKLVDNQYELHMVTKQW